MLFLACSMVIGFQSCKQAAEKANTVTDQMEEMADDAAEAADEAAEAAGDAAEAAGDAVEGAVEGAVDVVVPEQEHQDRAVEFDFEQSFVDGRFAGRERQERGDQAPAQSRRPGSVGHHQNPTLRPRRRKRWGVNRLSIFPKSGFAISGTV